MQIAQWQTPDIDSIAEAEAQIFKVPWSGAMLAQEMGNPFFIMYTAKQGDSLCGYIGYYLIADELHIANLAVLPAYRGSGVAKSLIRRVLGDAKTLGSYGITLEVRTSNIAAISLYSSFGFRVKGVRKKYYENTEDAYIMWRFLQEI